MENLRVGICSHTQTEVVQQKFGEEWVCIHDDTREQELENIRTCHLLDWLQDVPFKDLVKIFPHSNLLELSGDEMEEELTHLEEVWCRKSTEERDLIKLSL